MADNFPGIVAIRDSKDRTGPVLVFSSAAFAAFTKAVRAGDLDLPTTTR